MGLVDLSRTIYPNMPRIPILPEVEFLPVRRIDDGHPLNVSELRIATHAGTHVDAPWHFVPGGKTIDEIPLDRLAGTAVVVQVSRGGGEAVPASDLEAAGIEENDIVFLHTGWGDKFESDQYNDHPYLSDEAARWLVDHRIKIIGLDTITVDMPTAVRPQGFTFPVHHILLENEVLIIENLTNLEKVAGQRVQVYAFPLKIQGGDAGQARVVAEVA
jgi:kynurenine formamidase